MRHPHLRFAAPFLLVALGNCTPKADPTSGTTGAGGSGGTGAATSGSGGGSTTDTGTGTGTGGGSTSTGTSTGTGGPGATGWTAIPILDDTTDPNNKVFRSGNDRVTGIHFASLDDGVVTTEGDGESASNGGAIYKAKHTQIASLLFSGNRNGLCLLGTIDFHGINKSSDGYVALSYACDVIASHDGGKTFGIQPSSSGSEFGIEPVLAMRSLPSGTLMVAHTGYITKTDGVPGPNATWTDIWAPAAVPPIPNPVPADQCQDGPRSSGVPLSPSAVHVSADGQLIAYASSPDFNPQVCVSTDGGKSFFPKLLPNVPSDAGDFPPSGVAFANATTGIAYWANNIYPDATYIYRTTDAGTTWKPVEVPAAVAHKDIELRAASFAPGGSRGWIVGYDYGASRALILRTDDAGATWTKVGGDLGAKVDAAGGGKLWSIFALDDNHLWVGGNKGVLMANDAGGL